MKKMEKLPKNFDQVVSSKHRQAQYLLMIGENISKITNTSIQTLAIEKEFGNKRIDLVCIDSNKVITFLR